MKNVFVLYHANCFDGTGARYAAWRYYGNAAKYIPVQYGKPFPKEVPLDKDTFVLIVDFSYPRDVLDGIYEKVGRLVVLDHHKTAEAALEGAPYAKFDMNKSGAVMTWEFLHPGKEIPKLLLNVQDGDLWKFQVENTEEIRAALPLLEGDMKDWDQTARNNARYKEIVRDGKTILDFNNIKIKGIVKNNVKVLPYRGYKAGVCNATTLVSEIGNAIYDNKDLNVDFGLTYFFDKDGTPFLSFRSKGDMDVKTLAEELGGGGHPNAAGAKVTLDFIDKLYKGLL